MGGRDVVAGDATGDLGVLRVLLARRADHSTPGARRDGHRVALVAGGGGMRGAYIAGMLRALDRAGLRPGFDEAYGASSGAVSAAAFLTGSAEDGAACFPEDLACRRFIDLRRLARGRPAVSLDYFLDDVLCRRKPMRWAALRDGPARLRVIATDVADLTARELQPQSVPEWRQAIRASATIPLLGGPPVRHAGHRWVDGSIAEPLATRRALRSGATHVLVLLCRGPRELHPGPHTRLAWWTPSVDRLVPGLGTLAQGSRRYRAELGWIAAAAADPSGGRVLAVAPTRSAGVGSLDVDPARVGEAVRIGEESMTSALGLAGPAARDKP